MATRNIKIEDWRLYLIGVWRFVRRVAQRFHEDRCTRVAGALSFTSFLALVPFTAVAFAILSVFPVFQSWVAAINRFIYVNFVPASGEVVQQYLGEFAARAGGLTAFGLLFLVVASILLFATIEDAFNDIWRVAGRRRPMQRFVTYWAILTIGPILIGAGVSLTAYVAGMSVIVKNGWFSDTVLLVIPFLFELIAFILLYTIVPNVNVKRRHALIGATVATLLFEMAKRGFVFFVDNFASYHLVYGAVAALPVFLTWVYLSWLVTLLGAVVVASLPRWRDALNASS